jgi:beta-amylase
MTAFQRHFAPQAAQIAEINISLGPSGELRYPSYGAHDVGSGYPTRGALQAYSTLARASFRAFLTAKYGGVAADQASELMAPPADPAGFFARREQIETQRGRDFFDWYADSLLAHGRRVMTKAQQIFGAPGAPLRGVDLGAKIPGIHWRLGHYAGGKLVLDDRLAELAAGLIRTSGHDWGSDATGHGYGPLLRMFAALPRRGSGLTVHFTCLEMADGQDKPAAQSLPQSLVRWVGAEAVRQGLRVKGENALGWNIPNKDSWERMRAALSLPGQTGWYQGLTLLRMSDIVASPVAMAELRKTTAAAHAASAMR